MGKAAFVLLSISCIAPLPSLAQHYPVKPLRIVVGFPPGGGTDTFARVLGPKLGESLGQPVIVDNRPGADTNIATAYVSRATPDGYTLLMNTGAIAINMSLHEKPGYDVVRDFAPISLVATGPHTIVVGPALQVKTLKELVELARARPGQLNLAATTGAQQLAGELFKLRTKTNIAAVPYQGGGPALTAVLSGEVHMGVANIPSMISYAKAGRLRALGVAASTRSVLLPDVPTMIEQGVDMRSAVWYGLFAPAATPKAIISRLNESTVKVLAANDVRQRVLDLGAEAVGSTPEAFAAHVRAEVKQWAEVVRLVGAKPN